MYRATVYQIHKVANFLVVSNDLHEGWNDSIAVLRCGAGEILGTLNIP
jgi:hypothetical protein